MSQNLKRRRLTAGEKSKERHEVIETRTGHSEWDNTERKMREWRKCVGWSDSPGTGEGMVNGEEVRKMR